MAFLLSNARGASVAKLVRYSVHSLYIHSFLNMCHNNHFARCVYIIIAAWCNLHSHSYHHHDDNNSNNHNNYNDDDIKSKCTYQDKRQFSKNEIESFEFVELPNGCRCVIGHSIIRVLNLIYTIYYCCCCCMHFEIACKILTHRIIGKKKVSIFSIFICRMKNSCFGRQSTRTILMLLSFLSFADVVCVPFLQFYYSAPLLRRDSCPQLHWYTHMRRMCRCQMAECRIGYFSAIWILSGRTIFMGC